MSMDLGSKGSLKADINVTPLVDVMLVLLIIMMLIAPMLRQGVPLTLPTANNSGEKPDTQGQTVVAIDSRSQFYVNLIPVTADEPTGYGSDPNGAVMSRKRADESVDTKRSKGQFCVPKSKFVRCIRTGGVKNDYSDGSEADYR